MNTSPDKIGFHDDQHYGPKSARFFRVTSFHRQLGHSLRIKQTGLLDATIRPPGSKSVTNRAFLLAALADGRSTLSGALDSEDTQVMRHALAQLGLTLENPTPGQWEVWGQGGVFPVTTGDIYIANSGTTARFLTAALAFSSGKYRVYGKDRMHERPIGDLLDALQTWGSCIVCEDRPGYPPLRIDGFSRDASASNVETTVEGTISSQFLSALLLAAPLATAQMPRIICVASTLVSVPYIRMTLQVMQSFGVSVQAADDYRRFEIPRGSRYVPTDYSIEPDASAASYFLAAAAVAGGRVTIEGLSRASLQGDIRFADCLAQMGCELEWQDQAVTIRRLPDQTLRGITVDMNAISDTAQTLAVVALFADGPTTITGIAHVRHKETDRIAAVATELRKLGATVQERDDGLTITPPPSLGKNDVEIATYDDHRMAMSFAIAGLRRPGIIILDPRCTEKTYPGFFDDLDRVCGNPLKHKERGDA